MKKEIHVSINNKLIYNVIVRRDYITLHNVNNNEDKIFKISECKEILNKEMFLFGMNDTLYQSITKCLRILKIKSILKN